MNITDIARIAVDMVGSDFSASAEEQEKDLHEEKLLKKFGPYQKGGDFLQQYFNR